MSLIAYVDGGSRGNPGPAGIGVVIEHPTGRRVEISECIGSRDNNYAEYAALLVALEYASAYQSPRLHVFSDSEVVVRQISGAYTCQSPGLRGIYELCRGLIDSLEHFSICHVRRENNQDADRLANEAMNRDKKNGKRTAPVDFWETALARVADRIQSARQLVAVEPN